jgi:cobalt-zinc-cadmium efflux system outer membrane protein
MERPRSRRRKRCLRFLGAGALIVSGCVTTSSPPASFAPVAELPAPAATAPAEAPANACPTAEGPLTLEGLLQLTEANNPDLASVRARVQVAQGRLVQAGLYPNPIVTLREDELGLKENVWGFPAITIAQDIVTHHKIPLAKAAAAHGVAAADWLAMTTYFNVRTRVRAAYYELLAAERDVAASRELLRLSGLGLAAARKLAQAGAGTQPDVLRAEVDRAQGRIRLETAQRRLEAAGRLLAAAVGVPALPVPAGEKCVAPLIAGDLDAPTPALDWDALRDAVLTRSSEVQEAQALAMQAEFLLKRAEADAKPNITATVRPIWNALTSGMEVLIEIGAPVPIFNRNQGNILSARADVARTEADVRSVQMRLTERLAASYQRYQVARRQVETFRRDILPRATESLRLVRLGYERGDPKYDYTTLLQVELTLDQARLAQVTAQGDLWRALSEIRGMLQYDGPLDGDLSGCLNQAPGRPRAETLGPPRSQKDTP